MGAPKPRYRIELEAQPDGVPPAIRLKRLLKIMLRGYGLRALRVEEVPADGPPVPVSDDPMDSSPAAPGW